MNFIKITWIMVNAILAAAEFMEDSDLSLWNKFEWDLLLQRSRQDEFLLKGILDVKEVKNKIRIPAATCNETTTWQSSEKIAFQMQCRCDLDFSSFLPKSKRCISNYELKQGCRYTTGSWKWLTKWTWDEMKDAPMVLDSKNGYGITVGLNVTTKEYRRCMVKSISYLKENTEWVVLNYLMDNSTPVFFKFKNVWHISWNFVDLSNELKKSIEGEILKFVIDCEREMVVEDSDEQLENTLSSCMVFKVSGRLQFTLELNDTSKVQTTATTMTTPHSSSEGNNTTTVLVATLISVTMVILVIVMVCYLRRRAFFAVRNTEANFVETHVVAPMLNRTDDETFV